MATKTKEPITVVPTKNPDRQTDQSISEKIAMAFGKFWNVIVWNDDIHSFEEVIDCLMQVLGINEQDAFTHAYTVHTLGKSVVASETQEKAEHYHAQIEEFGLFVTLERNS